MITLRDYRSRHRHRSCSHKKWHCAFTQHSTECWDHSSSHITTALNLQPQYVPGTKPFPFCFWLLAILQSWFVARRPLVQYRHLSGVISLWILEKKLNWANWPLPVAAHVGVVRIEGRRQRDQAKQVEPQQGLGRNPTGPHRPPPCVLGEAERDSEKQDWALKRCDDVFRNQNRQTTSTSKIKICKINKALMIGSMENGEEDKTSHSHQGSKYRHLFFNLSQYDDSQKK